MMKIMTLDERENIALYEAKTVVKEAFNMLNIFTRRTVFKTLITVKTEPISSREIHSD